VEIGSREAITYFYKNQKKIMVRCGCFWGSFSKFIEQVKITYPPKHKHRKQYLKEISKVKKLWNIKEA